MNDIQARNNMQAKPHSKEVFLQKFVLTRAGDAHNGTDGERWAREALFAWNFIKKELKDRPE